MEFGCGKCKYADRGNWSRNDFEIDWGGMSWKIAIVVECIFEFEQTQSIFGVTNRAGQL